MALAMLGFLFAAMIAGFAGNVAQSLFGLNDDQAMFVMAGALIVAIWVGCWYAITRLGADFDEQIR